MNSGTPVTPDINKELSDFIDYVDSFYGTNDPVYPMKSVVGNVPLDKDTILDATHKYLSIINKRNSESFTWGGGDSLDRERVRDIILSDYDFFLTHLQQKEF